MSDTDCFFYLSRRHEHKRQQEVRFYAVPTAEVQADGMDSKFRFYYRKKVADSFVIWQKERIYMDSVTCPRIKKINECFSLVDFWAHVKQ